MKKQKLSKEQEIKISEEQYKKQLNLKFCVLGKDYKEKYDNGEVIK